METALTLQGRRIGSNELSTIQELIADHPNWHRTRLSQALCERWAWVNKNGQVQDMAARTLLRKLDDAGLIELPVSVQSANNAFRNRPVTLMHSIWTVHLSKRDYMSNQTSDLRSPLATPIHEFFSHHRALGKCFDTEESALRLLDHYLLAQEIESLDAITPALLEAFLRSRPRRRPRSYNHRLNVRQRLFHWLEVQGTLALSPLHARPRRCSSPPIPFLFEPRQVERLLALAAQPPDRPHAHRRGITYRLIFALMYALGLRVSEVARLCYKDVDWDRQCLIIGQSKFAKSRLVPFGPRLDQALRDYIQDASLGARSADDPLFSLAKDARRAIYAKTISGTFQRLVPSLGIMVAPGVAPPRLHCLRHSFAVANLLRWYRTGVDLAARLNAQGVPGPM